MAALTLKIKHPDLAITVVRSKEIGIIGVGEGTTPGILKHLHGYLGLDPAAFYQKARPTWKLGIRFLWGPRRSFDYTFGSQVDWKWQNLSRPNGFYCEDNFDYVDAASALMSQNRVFMRQPSGEPLLDRNAAYHLENETFVSYLEGEAVRVGIQIRDDTVREAQLGEEGIAALRLASGELVTADLYIDCSGFRSFLLGSTLSEPYISFRSSLFCDRAVVGGWDRTDEPIKPYTTAATMNSGWCWQIEHESRINSGYVYSSDFISDEDAEVEFRAKNPRVSTARIVKFTSGRYRHSWVKNVVAVGNASGFVEPLEATSLMAIGYECRILAEVLTDCNRDPGAASRALFNRVIGQTWDNIREFLAMHYRFNRRLDTAFWHACLADVDLVDAGPLVDYYKENGPSLMAKQIMHGKVEPFGVEGYFVMLIGQKVPSRTVYTPSDQEKSIWDSMRKENYLRAVGGFTTSEALAVIRSPQWQWNPAYYDYSRLM